MPLTTPQKNAYNQLLIDVAALKASLGLMDPEQNGIRIFLDLFEKSTVRVKDHKDKG